MEITLSIILVLVGLLVLGLYALLFFHKHGILTGKDEDDKRNLQRK